MLDGHYTISFSDFISPRQHIGNNSDYYIKMAEKDTLNQKEAQPSTQMSTPDILTVEHPSNTIPSELDIFLDDLSSPHLGRETIQSLVEGLTETLNTLNDTDLLTYIYNAINQKARLCDYKEIRETFSKINLVKNFRGGPEVFFTAALTMVGDDNPETSQTASVSGSSIKETSGLDNVGNTCWLNAATQNCRTMFQQDRLTSYLTTLNSKIQGNVFKQTLYDELNKLLKNEVDSTEPFVVALEAAVEPIRIRGIGHSATKLTELLSYAFNLDSSQNISEEDAYFNEYGVSDCQIGIDDQGTYFSSSETKADVLKIQLPLVAKPADKINIGDIFSAEEHLTEGNEWHPDDCDRSFTNKKRVLQHAPKSLCVNIDRKIYTSEGEKTIENPLSYYHHEGQDYLYFYEKVDGEDSIKKTWYKVESEAVHTGGFHWVAYNRNEDGALVEYDDISVNEVAERRYHLTSQLMLSKTSLELETVLNSSVSTSIQVSEGTPATHHDSTTVESIPQGAAETQQQTTKERVEQLISEINDAVKDTSLRTSTRYETYKSLKTKTDHLINELNGKIDELKKILTEQTKGKKFEIIQLNIKNKKSSFKSTSRKTRATNPFYKRI